jgi:hypothetical protein
VSLKDHELFGFFVKGNCPKSVHCIQLEEVTLAVQILNFVCRQREGTHNWFEAASCFIVTLYDVGGTSLGMPGSRFARHYD